MASQETWQSPISPGLSWCQATVGERPSYAALDGSRTCDVAIIGGGYTGLQAAYNLAKSGVSVVLIEACRPRSTMLAKCSCATEASPRSQRSPSSRR